jgi:F-type H+-transporting ATPase subunit b
MTFNGWTFLFEVLNFLVLAYLLHRLLYRPLHDAIDARRAATLQTQAEAEKARQDALALQQRLQEQQAAQERERQDLLRTSREQAEADRKRLLAEAEQTVQRRHAESRQALEREREEALQAVRAAVIREAVTATQRLLREAADRSLDDQLVLRLIETMDTLSEADRERVRGDWAAGDGAVLETAPGLNGSATEPVREAVARLLGQPVELAVQSRPELLGGARLRLGGHVWDASLAGQLDGAADAPREASHHG